MKKANGILPGGIPPVSGFRPPKLGHNYYMCKKCGHHFEGLLPICPECKAIIPDVVPETMLRY
jgi:rubrerythrin